MKYRIYFFLIVFVFMIGGLWASPVKVIVRQPVLPVLTLKEANPVLRLEFVKQASGDCAVREIVCSLKGSTDLTDIEHIRLYASAADGTLSVEHPLTLPMQVSEKVSFKGTFGLERRYDPCLGDVEIEGPGQSFSPCPIGLLFGKNSEGKRRSFAGWLFGGFASWCGCTSVWTRWSEYFPYSGHRYFKERNITGCLRCTL